MAKARPITDLDIQAPTGVNARIIAKMRLAEIYAWQQYVDNPYYVHELHNLRIAAKRLRYTLEIFADVLPQAVVPLLQEVEQIQEELGSLHDSDVMIALLRLCLGVVDGGTSYADVLAQAGKLQKKARFVVDPAMLMSLLDPDVVPSAGERRGLEALLQARQQRRSEQYTSFYQHWSQLIARDFYQELLAALDNDH